MQIRYNKIIPQLKEVLFYETKFLIIKLKHGKNIYMWFKKEKFEQHIQETIEVIVYNKFLEIEYLNIQMKMILS